MPLVGGRLCVPAAPIARACRAYLDHGLSMRLEPRERQLIAGPCALASMIWPEMSASAGSKRLWLIVNEQRWVTIDLADRILCVLDRVELWRTDPELNAEYEVLGLEV